MRNVWFVFAILAAVIVLLTLTGCPSGEESKPTTESGVRQVSVTNDIVKTDAKGMTAEQRNIVHRLREDNRPGSIKHLYVISAFSGDVILYSAVDGKVTSSGKRLKPYSVAAQDNQSCSYELRGIPVEISGQMRRTTEVIQDDGTYGSSIRYLYWKTPQGTFHKHYISGGQIVHISDQPLRVGKVLISLDMSE
jgi:hypothetical protein